MNNLAQKSLMIVVNATRWIFGIFLALGAFVNFSQNPIPCLFLFFGAFVMLPPVSKWIMKKSNHKLKNSVIASIGFIISMIAIGNTNLPPTNQPTTNATAHKTITKPTTQTVTKIAPLVAPITQSSTPQATKNQPNITLTPSGYDITCKVVGVSDGDTITCLKDGNSQIKVRLNQIDAPEKAQAFGNAAKQALSGYVFGKIVGIKTSGMDKYGRTIGEIYLGDKNINKAMVTDGYAWAYREYMKDNEYGDLETSARSSTKGLWSEPDPIYPSDFRRGKRGEQTAPVQTQSISEQVEQKAITNSDGSCGSKRYCKEMATCSEARHYLNDCGVSRLDRDGDGVPCESICN